MLLLSLYYVVNQLAPAGACSNGLVTTSGDSE